MQKDEEAFNKLLFRNLSHTIYLLALRRCKVLDSADIGIILRGLERSRCVPFDRLMGLSEHNAEVGIHIKA